MRRILAPLLGAALITLLIVGLAKAADPLIGGTLTADATHATVLSAATMPVLVTMDTGSAVADPASFRLEPGQTATVALSGAVGTVSAHLAALNASGTASAVTLTVKVAPVVPPGPDYRGWLYGLLGLGLAGSVAYRLRHLRIRIERKEGPA